MLIRLSDSARLFHADCRDAIKSLPDDSIDSVVTDPPYGLQFMGKEWDKLWRDRTDVDKAWRDAHEGTLAARARKLPDYSTMSKGADMQATHLEWAKEVFRVLKPGGHIAAFSASRTYHRMACAIEDAGFEIRDSLMWLYAVGFPKSRNVSRDETFCQCESSSERDVRCVPCANVPTTERPSEKRAQILQSCLSKQGLHAQGSQAETGRIQASVRTNEPVMEGRSVPSGTEGQLRVDEVRPMSARISTDGPSGRLRHGASLGDGEALQAYSYANAMRASSGPQSEEQRAAEPRTLAGQSFAQDGGAWSHCGRCRKPMVPDGLGTALKPAFEPIVLARKPLSEGTVAANVLRWGTGALNIDGCRVGFEDGDTTASGVRAGQGKGRGTYEGPALHATVGGVVAPPHVLGRWPANVVLSYPEDTYELRPDVTAEQRAELEVWLAANS